MMSSDLRQTNLTSTSIRAEARALGATIQGDTVLQGDGDFASARRVWNAGLDRDPAVIARCETPTDVVRALAFSRAHGLDLAVRSGGHGIGHGASDNGMVIDLARMNAIAIDRQRKVARIEAGSTWGEVARELSAVGLALTSGDMATVGVGGLTLGGGIGWMVRKHGLTIDNLRSVDLVTADGDCITASHTQNADLFWGLRGGGGNFGIATAFEFDVHEVSLIVGGATIYPIADAFSTVAAAAEYASRAPEELTTMIIIMQAPPAPFIPPHLQGTLVVVVAVCYVGDLEEGARIVEPLRRLAVPIADIIGPMPYPAIFALTQEGGVKGNHHAVRSLFLDSIDERALKLMVEHAESMPGPVSLAQLRILGGAMSRVPSSATAFAHRGAPAMFSALSTWHDLESTATNRGWADRTFAALRSFSHGAYANFLENEGEGRIREAYPARTYERLVELKNRYDPDNVFRSNQNIAPTLGAESDDERQIA